MGLTKGDLLKIYLQEDGHLLISEKVDLSPSVLAQAGVTMYPPPSELSNKEDYTSI